MKKIILMLSLLVIAMLIIGCGGEVVDDEVVDDEKVPDEILLEEGEIVPPELDDEAGVGLSGHAISPGDIKITHNDVEVIKVSPNQPNIVFEVTVSGNDVFLKKAKVVDLYNNQVGEYIEFNGCNGWWCKVGIYSNEPNKKWKVPADIYAGTYTFQLYEGSGWVDKKSFESYGPPAPVLTSTEVTIVDDSIAVGENLQISITKGNADIGSRIYFNHLGVGYVKQMGTYLHVKTCDPSCTDGETKIVSFDTTVLVPGNYKLYTRIGGIAKFIPFTVESACDPATCADDQCGQVDDGCGVMLDCGECGAAGDDTEKTDVCTLIGCGTGYSRMFSLTRESCDVEFPTTDNYWEKDNVVECGWNSSGICQEGIGCCIGNVLSNICDGNQVINTTENHCTGVNDVDTFDCSVTGRECGILHANKNGCFKYKCPAITGGTNEGGEFTCTGVDYNWCYTDNTTFADCMTSSVFKSKCAEAGTCGN